MPIRILMAVVLPAPLRPNRPHTEPLGTDKSSPSSGVTSLNCFLRPSASMMMDSATGPSLAGSFRECGFEQATNLIVRQAAGAQLLHGARDNRSRAPEFLRL